jgi:hypothetical protein
MRAPEITLRDGYTQDSPVTNVTLPAADGANTRTTAVTGAKSDAEVL